MSSQIIFFEKSKCDFSIDDVSATASQGSTHAEKPLNRSNYTAWITTGSVDADNTTWEVDMVDEKLVSEILLIGMNFAAYTIKYWDGAAYQDFATPISVSGNTAENKRHTVTQVSTTKLKITITGTIVADSDKYLKQFVASNLIGQLNGWPIVDNPETSRNKSISKMLSGKALVRERIGNFACSLKVKSVTDTDDIGVFEDLFNANEGFLVSLGGFDEDQFTVGARQGWRQKDLYLMKTKNEYRPIYKDGIYTNGIIENVQLIEVVD